MIDSFISDPTSKNSDVVVSFKQVDIIFGDEQAKSTIEHLEGSGGFRGLWDTSRASESIILHVNSIKS